MCHVTPDCSLKSYSPSAACTTGDDSGAFLAAVNGPKHLYMDRDDPILIADAENNLIRRYVPATGKILLVAGSGGYGAASINGPPAYCERARPPRRHRPPRRNALYDR